ncbi:hypothetical protein IEQ34_008357 [Dendrobium chrysotoxum]|uniref:Uncharacterized protein n=1 Tax=Dendrobium chrysotoxum TaxID=161865 RepID=A0AAV7GWB9_DENCH|nr:hypothetical protein IEQ34_008357 [Dendrobium chrysotoxum]
MTREQGTSTSQASRCGRGGAGTDKLGRANERNELDIVILFGRPLKVDNATPVGSRPSLARVMVELDITKKYPKKVWLGLDKFGHIQSVEMEAFHPFCDHCKALGHTVGNEIGAVENVVVDGNVGTVSSNPLCPITSSNDVLIIVGNGVEATGAIDHSIDVGLVGPPLVVFDGGSPIVLVVLEADAHVSENLDVCNVNFDGHEDGEGVAPSVKDSLAPVSFQDNLEVDNMGVCNCNIVVSNDSTSDLVVSSDEPSLSTPDPSLLEGLVQMVEVLITAISNEDMKAQLVVNLNESRSYGDMGEELDVHEECNAMFKLKENRIVEKAFSIGGGKQRRHKSNRKLLFAFMVAGCWWVLAFDWMGGKVLWLDYDEAGFLYATLDGLACLGNLGGYLAENLDSFHFLLKQAENPDLLTNDPPTETPTRQETTNREYDSDPCLEQFL